MLSLGKTYQRELRHHRENTIDTHIKCYTASQLAFMDGIDIRTVKKSGKYLPVRIDHCQAQYNYRNGRQKRPYVQMYIRVDEVKFIFRKRNKGKKLVEE